jgi:hypothetical protein
MVSSSTVRWLSSLPRTCVATLRMRPATTAPPARTSTRAPRSASSSLVRLTSGASGSRSLRNCSSIGAAVL